MCLPLLDNRPGYDYWYKVFVYTGGKSNAGTESKVYVEVMGEEEDSGVRCLTDGERKVKCYS